LDREGTIANVSVIIIIIIIMDDCELHHFNIKRIAISNGRTAHVSKQRGGYYLFGCRRRLG
jgi:hypothetical protein